MARFRKPRYEGWSNLAAIDGAAKTTPIARKYVISCTTPDALDRTGTAQLVVSADCPACAVLNPLDVVRIIDWTAGGVPGTVDEFRILTEDRMWGTGVGAGAGQVTYTLVHPLIDWSHVGQIATLLGGQPQFSITGEFTPAELGQIAIDMLTARGHGHWRMRTIERTDAKQVTITGQTPLELLIAIEKNWQLEAKAERVADDDWAVDLLKKVGAGAKRPHLRAGRAITKATVKRNATPYANRIRPAGADGVTIARAAWPVSGVAGTVVSLVDFSGGPGPIQIDGQLVGAYLQKVDGTRVAITATSRGDGFTSLVTVTSVAGISDDDVLEFRATADGEVVSALDDPAAIAERGVYEAPLPRPDLGGYRNWLPNPRGEAYASPSALPTGWAGVLGAGESITRVTSGPILDSCLIPVDAVWKVNIREPNMPIGLAGELAAAIDPVLGDETITYGLLLYIDYPLGKATNDEGAVETPPVPQLSLLSGDANARGLGGVKDLREGDPEMGRKWFVWSRTVPCSEMTPPVTAPTRFRPTLWFYDGFVELPGTVDEPPKTQETSMPITGIDVYFAGWVVTRGARKLTAADFLRVSEPNYLWHAANGALMQRRMVKEELGLTAIDRAQLLAALGDVPLVTGGDVDVTIPGLGLYRHRARLQSRPRDRNAPAPADLLLITATDPVAAALEGYASATRQLTLTEKIRALLGASTGTSNGVTVATKTITPGTGGTGGTGTDTGTGSTPTGPGAATSVPPQWISRPIIASGVRVDLPAVGVTLTELDEGLRWLEDLTYTYAVRTQGYADPTALGVGAVLVLAILLNGDGDEVPTALDGAAAAYAGNRWALDVPKLHASPAIQVAAAMRKPLTLGVFTVDGDGDTAATIAGLAFDKLPLSLAGYQGTAGSGPGTVVAAGDPGAVLTLPDVGVPVLRRLDAQSLYPLTDGSALATVPDRSGNANDGTATGAGPTFEVGALGTNRHAIQTPGTTGNGIELDNLVVGSHTLLMVVGINSAAGSSDLGYANACLFAADVTGTHNDYAITVRADGKVVAETADDGVVYGPGRSSKTTGSIFSGPKLYVWRRDATTGLHEQRINGVSQAVSSIPVTADLTDPPKVYIGDGGLALAGALAVALGLELEYGAVLDNTQVSKLEIAIMKFYGIPY